MEPRQAPAPCAHSRAAQSIADRSLRPFKSFLGLAMVGALALVGCGGGGGGGGSSGSSAPPPAAPAPLVGAEGLWEGTTSKGRSVRIIVYEDGRVFYFSSLISDTAQAGGFTQGQLTTVGASVSRTGIPTLYLLELTSGGPVVIVPSSSTADISGSFTSRQSFSGTITYPGFSTNETFTTTYNAAYETAANLNDVAGTFQSSAYVGSNLISLPLTVTNNGAMSGVLGLNCSLVGILTRHLSRGVYDVQVALQGSGCSITSTLTGAAYYNPATKLLTFSAVDSNTGALFLFNGTKP